VGACGAVRLGEVVAATSAPKLPLARRRVQVASILASIALITCVLGTLSAPGAFVLFLLVFFFSLSLPACGYFGVKNRSSSLVMAFVGCNACMFALEVANVAWALSGNRSPSTIAASVIGSIYAVINFCGCYYGFQLTSKAPEYFQTDIPVAPPAAVAPSQHISAQPQHVSVAPYSGSSV
jgi:hypothetical protein